MTPEIDPELAMRAAGVFAGLAGSAALAGAIGFYAGVRRAKGAGALVRTLAGFGGLYLANLAVYGSAIFAFVIWWFWFP